MSLEEVTSQLGLHYKEWKAAEKEKDKFKKEFFKLATEAVEDSLAEQVVDVGYRGMPEVDARNLLANGYPRWTVTDIRVSSDGYEAILKENPALKKFSFVNADGLMYERQVSVGSPIIDDEALQIQDPELYERITYVPEPERVLRPLEELDADDLSALGQYIYDGKATVKLAAPRKAKTEELDEASE